MKLCIVTHKLIKGDGQGRVNYEVAKEAIRRSHQVTLLSSGVAPELQHSTQVNWIEISVKGFPTELVRNIVFAQKSANWLRKHRDQFDVIKVNGAITRGKADINAVHFVHSSWLRSPVNLSQQHRSLRSLYHHLYAQLNAHWEKQAFRDAKVIVAVSEKVKQELVEIGVPAECIRVILNGVDLEEFFPGSVERQKLGLPEDVILAMFAGDIQTPRKNLDTVLNALVQVPDLHLVVVGNATRSPYPQLAKSLGLETRVHFMGYQPDMPQIMQAVDLFVFPSRYEPFGLVVTEAMATGLPVITAATTGAADLVTPDCGIVLANPDDTQALVDALKTLNSDRDRLQKMGQSARSVAEQHSWATMASSYVDLFEEICH